MNLLALYSGLVPAACTRPIKLDFIGRWVPFSALERTGAGTYDRKAISVAFGSPWHGSRTSSLGPCLSLRASSTVNMSMEAGLRTHQIVLTVKKQENGGLIHHTSEVLTIAFWSGWRECWVFFKDLGEVWLTGENCFRSCSEAGNVQRRLMM